MLLASLRPVPRFCLVTNSFCSIAHARPTPRRIALLVNDCNLPPHCTVCKSMLWASASGMRCDGGCMAMTWIGDKHACSGHIMKHVARRECHHDIVYEMPWSCHRCSGGSAVCPIRMPPARYRGVGATCRPPTPPHHPYTTHTHTYMCTHWQYDAESLHAQM